MSEAPVRASASSRAYGAVQRRAGAAPSDPATVMPAAEAGVAGSGQGLPFREQMESGFGASFEDVRVHTDAGAASASKAIHADAYTMGSDIAFASTPTPDLVAHELAHVVQQRSGAGPSSGVGAAGDAFEAEADAAAATIASGGTTNLVGSHGGAATSGGPVQRRAVQRNLWGLEETRADVESRTPEPTKAKKERDYKPTGTLASKVGDNHYRLWGYEVGSAEVPAGFLEILAEVAGVLYNDPAATVMIHGHTSQSGAEAGNTSLSFRRTQGIISALTGFGASTDHCVPIPHGEADPLLDEDAGPAAMAHNRRVEIKIIPGPKAAAAPTPDVDTPSPNPPVGDEVKEALLGCRDLAMYIRLNKAELVVWTMVESQGMRSGHGVPTMGYGDDYQQPDLVDWQMAYSGEHIPKTIGDAWYDQLKQPLGANLLAYKNELVRQNEKYESMIAADECDENAPLDEWFSDKDYQTEKKDPMPGDRDPKGRYY